MPDFIFDSEAAIPEDLRSLATKTADGKVSINLVPKSKLDEFRENNIKAAKERDDALAALTSYKSVVGDDVTKFSDELNDLRQTKQKVNDGKLKASDDVEKVLADRTTAMRSDFENRSQLQAKENSALKDDIAKLQTNLKQIHIDRRVTEAVLDAKSGALPEALPHFLLEAYKIFTVDDSSNVVPKQGEAIIYGADGTSPMTPQEWIGTLKEKIPYLFKQSVGGGAAGGKDARYGGLNESDWKKLSASQKLTIANQSK